MELLGKQTFAFAGTPQYRLAVRQLPLPVARLLRIEHSLCRGSRQAQHCHLERVRQHYEWPCTHLQLIVKQKMSKTNEPCE